MMIDAFVWFSKEEEAGEFWRPAVRLDIQNSKEDKIEEKIKKMQKFLDNWYQKYKGKSLKEIILNNTICLKGIKHSKALKLMGYEIVFGLRKCEHKNIKERNWGGQCLDCKSFLTKPVVCVLKDIRKIKECPEIALRDLLNC